VIDLSARITRVEWASLQGRRPRVAGCNARLGSHGDTIRVPILRLSTSDGASGFGICWAGAEQIQSLVGQPLDALFNAETGTRDAWLAFDTPLWDLAGQRSAAPVYALAADMLRRPAPQSLRAPVYDTSLYFDDLHLTSAEQAADFIAEEARSGYARGHRAFKLKVGRGARHLPLVEGTARDIAIIRAVRQAVGPQAPLMIDANNGYNLNLTKQVLTETADCGVFWLEEAFHEDPVLYQDLKNWLAGQGLNILIADGEGDASTHLLEWARSGLIDVVQYDVFGHGFTRWLQTGKQLDAWGVHSAPHHYGCLYGNYTGCHLAPLTDHFTSVEWDEASAPGLDASAYTLENGFVNVPSAPGFGLKLDEGIFQLKIAENGGFFQE
jgi:L-rhamnonate dehydratase